MMTKRVVFLLVLSMVLMAGCGDEGEKRDSPEFKSSIPENGAANVDPDAEVIVTFDEVVTLASPHGITLNEHDVTITGRLTEIIIEAILEPETHYLVNVPAGAVINTFGIPLSKGFSFGFTTRALSEQQIKPTLAVSNPSPQADNLYNYLIENYGVKTISGACANVSWNINESEWVYHHTGKYPALNGFDLIHLWASPANWINYEDISVVQEWWNNNGLVHLMWHWNVPSEQGSSQYAFYTHQTSFDIREAVKEGTWENEVILADLEKAADIIELLRDLEIPVIWRPLHEAAGTWFWWGAKGAEPCKALWRMMFEYFETRELNNLIWVWTVEPNDDAWYPGDEYVDMIGRDIYNRHDVQSIASEFNEIQNRFADKMISLSECGNLSTITSQWNGGAQWSFFMPWYDYHRTVNTSGANFNSGEHEFANAAWWQDAFDSEFVLSRDQIPDLK